MNRRMIAIVTAVTVMSVCGCEKRYRVSLAPGGVNRITATKKVAVATDMSATEELAHIWGSGSLGQIADDVTSELMDRGYQVVMVDEGCLNFDVVERETTTQEVHGERGKQKIRERRSNIRDPEIRFERAMELGIELLFEFSGACVEKTSTRVTVIPYVPVSWSEMKHYTKLRSLRLRVSDVRTREIVASIVVEYEGSTEHPGQAVRDTFQEFDRILFTRPVLGQMPTP